MAQDCCFPTQKHWLCKCPHSLLSFIGKKMVMVLISISLHSSENGHCLSFFIFSIFLNHLFIRILYRGYQPHRVSSKHCFSVSCFALSYPSGSLSRYLSCLVAASSCSLEQESSGGIDPVARRAISTPESKWPGMLSRLLLTPL